MSTPPTVPDISDKLFINNMSLKQFNVFIGTVLILFGGIFLLAAMSPDSHVTRMRPASGCVPWVYSNLGLPCDTFTLDKTPSTMIDIADLTPSNKFLTLDIIPVKKSSFAQSEATVKVEVSAYTILDNDFSDIYSAETDEYTFDCSDTKSPNCETKTILTLTNLKYKHYYLVVKFVNSQDLSPLFQDIAFSTTTLNPSYKSYIFVVKFIFFIASVSAFLYYMFKSFWMKKEHFSKELKSLEYLFPVLLLFNEPFTAQIFGGVIYSWIITAAFVAGSALLLKFWLTLLNDILPPSSTIFVFRGPALKMYLLVYSGVTWMSYIIYQSSIPHNPTSDFSFGSGLLFNFLSIAARLITLGAVVTVHFNREILVQVDAANERERFLFWFSIAFYLIFVDLVATGGLSPLSHDGTKMLLFSGVATLYIISSSYLYLVNKDAGRGPNPEVDRSQVRGSYFDGSPEFAPQVKGHEETEKIEIKTPGLGPNENYPPEIKGEDDF